MKHYDIGKMLFKMMCMFGLLTIAAAVDGTRQIRSPGGAGWQGNGIDRGAVFSARSLPGGYGGSGRSSGWGGSSLSRSQSFGGSSGWQGSGRSLGFNSGWAGSNSRTSDFDTYSSGW